MLRRKSVYRAKREGKDYVITSVQIEREVWDKLLEVGPKLFGVSRGWLSPLVNEALKLYLAPRTHTTHANPPRKVWDKFRSVKKALAELLGVEEGMIRDVLRKQLEVAITMAIGSDQRTIDKYLKLFTKVGLIKPVSDPRLPPEKQVYEVIG